MAVPFMQGAGVTLHPLGGQAAGTHASTFAASTAGGGIPLIRYSYSSPIYLRNGDYFPFTVLTQTIPRKISGWDDRHRWKEDAPYPERDSLAGSLTAGASTFVVTTGMKFHVKDTIYIRDLSKMGWVTAINQTTGAMTVAWIGGAPAAGAVPGTVISVIGTAHYEIDSATNRARTVPCELYNRFQDLRHSLQFGDLYSQGRFYDFVPNGDPNYQMKKLLWTHHVELEKTRIWGVRGVLTANANSAGFMNGIYQLAATNRRNNLGAAWTQATFENWLAPIFRQHGDMDPNNWWYLCSSRQTGQISRFAQPAERTATGKTKFGMYITELQHPEGVVLNIKRHPLFDSMGWDDLGILIHRTPEALAEVTHTIFGTRLYEAIVPYNITADEKMVRTVTTLEAKWEAGNLAIAENVGP